MRIAETLFRPLYLWIGFFFFVPIFKPQLLATHIVGGDITYRCLGNDRYAISLTVRRDCINGNPGAQFDDPAALGIFDGNGVLRTELARLGVLQMPFRPDDTLNEVVTTRCGIIGGNICVHTTTYTDTVVLPFRPEGYILAYQRCCRNFTISNIIDPLTVGSTFTVRITAEALMQCNSSPLLNDWPPVYVCGDAPLNFNLRATDPDGDSLVYEICNPLTGANQANPRPDPPSNPPYAFVAFKAPYSLADVIGGNPKLNIHISSGRMTGYVEPPITQYLVAYCVREYRKGVLLSELQREFQINVRSCVSNAIADFDYELNNCEDSVRIQFTNKSSAPNSSLSLTHWVFQWNGNTQTSGLQNPAVVLGDSGVLRVRLFAESREGCRDTIERLINFRSYSPKWTSDSIKICKGDSVRLVKNFIPGLKFEWQPAAGLSCDNCPDPIAFPSQDTWYKLLTKDDLCERIDSVLVRVSPCLLDSCAVNIRERCLPGGSVELTVEDANGNIVRPMARRHELFWNLKATATQSPYSIREQNPIVVAKGTEYSLTSKIYSWKKGLPKSIEFADICQRRIHGVAKLDCSGPCDELDFILSSCDDVYDIQNNLNFPPSICKSICLNDCEYIIALFEKNGQLINPSDYQIKWSTGGSGSHVMMMGPYYNQLTVEVRKGDCVWYGRYLRACPARTQSAGDPSFMLSSIQPKSNCNSIQERYQEVVGSKEILENDGGSSSIETSIVLESPNDIEPQWIIYPNPFSDDVGLIPFHFKNNLELVQINLFRSDGQFLKSYRPLLKEGMRFAFPSEDLSFSGVYIVQIEAGGRQYYRKMVKL
ncbi:MAG: T9SS type A sorting domain-containing protein [Saprospiraceae bacterium]|nr:T9SS type A sorting domain-containing protein [Saprospiraceae bacterium]